MTSDDTGRMVGQVAAPEAAREGALATVPRVRRDPADPAAPAGTTTAADPASRPRGGWHDLLGWPNWNPDGLRFRRLTSSSTDHAAATRLLGGCPPTDRIRRAGALDPACAAQWLLPRTPDDVALAAEDADGDLVGVANANADATAPATYEVAVLVAPGWRRQGTARTLLRRLAALLPAGATLTGVLESDYPPARALLATLAPEATVTRDRETTEFTVSVAAVGDR